MTKSLGPVPETAKELNRSTRSSELTLLHVLCLKYLFDHAILSTPLRQREPLSLCNSSESRLPFKVRTADSKQFCKWNVAEPFTPETPQDQVNASQVQHCFSRDSPVFPVWTHPIHNKCMIHNQIFIDFSPHNENFMSALSSTLK